MQASRFQPTPDAEGYSILWEARDQRCKKGGSPGAPTFSGCKSFEWQTSLYNTRSAPRPTRIHIRSQCAIKGSVPLYFAVAPHPAEIVEDKVKIRASKAWQEMEMPLETGAQTLKLDLPSRQKATLIAFLPEFGAEVSVPLGCKVQYRIEMSPL